MSRVLFQSKVSALGDMYWDRSSVKIFPTESYKYITTSWVDDYSWSTLSNMVYGTTSLYWVIMQANSITNPYGIVIGDEIRILKSEYLGDMIDG